MLPCAVPDGAKGLGPAARLDRTMGETLWLGAICHFEG
jgi:hypothetical protein